MCKCDILKALGIEVGIAKLFIQRNLSSVLFIYLNLQEVIMLFLNYTMC